MVLSTVTVSSDRKLWRAQGSLDLCFLDKGQRIDNARLLREHENKRTIQGAVSTTAG